MDSKSVSDDKNDKLIEKDIYLNKEKYIGIMSGTSLDGVDVVLCEVDHKSCILLESLEYPFPLELKEELLKMINCRDNTLQEVGEADHMLGLLFAKAVLALLELKNIDSSTVRAIGLHGQTMWHEPNSKFAFTMQLGDPNIVTVKTNIPVVADFRRKDVALGGQGAPFAPAFHAFLFEEMSNAVSIINIGGMANITVLGNKLIGYDTGCGNVLLDMWVHKHKNISYDRDGEWAREGKVEYTLLDLMMNDSYFSLPYPKSTGREYFNKKWLDEVQNRVQKDFKPKDIQRTLLELTALSISNEVLKFSRDILLLCGGGAKNSFLVERLKILMPNIEIAIVNNADSIEAMTFAWLAYKRVRKEVVNLKNVTGASENSILGGIYD